jgi:hypothetical protein
MLHCNSSQAAGYNLCELPPYVMEREILYCLEQTDSVRSESLVELIRFIRMAIPNAPSHCCTGQESVYRMQLLHAVSNYLDRLATPVQKGHSNINAHFIICIKCDSSISVAFTVPVS